MLQCGKPFFARNTTVYNIRKLHGTIFSSFYYISQPNFMFGSNQVLFKKLSIQSTKTLLLKTLFK